MGEGARESSATCQDSTAGRGPRRGRSALTDPVPAPAYVAWETLMGRLRLLADRSIVACSAVAFVRPQPFPGLVLDGRLRPGAVRPLAREVLADHHPLGASTGYMATRREDWASLVRRACEVSTFAVELSALGERELPGLLAFLAGRPRLPFHYLSVHAPTKGLRLPEPELVALLASLPPHVDAVVVHPDKLVDPAAWRPLGHRLVLENMDGRKPVGQRPEQLGALFAALPEAGFCLDVAHAAAVDPTMALAHALLDAHGGRLRQLHVSSLRRDRGSHVPLTRRDEARFCTALRRCPDVPWILEAPPPSR
jgi:hypothetical protein